MADENEIILDEMDQEEEQVEAGDDEAQGVEEAQDELTVEIDGYEEEPAEEVPLVKRLRDEIRERDRRIAQMTTAQVPKKVEIGKKPDLWDDCEGDADKHEAELLAWHDRKRAVDEQTQAAERESRVAQDKFNASHDAYRQHAAKLNVADYDEVEKNVAAVMPIHIQNAIPLYFGEKGPQIVLALGRRPKLLEEIVAIQDPVAQLLRIKEISMGVKVVQRKPPAPERGSILTGGAAAGSSDKKIEELEKRAQRTGNWDEVFAYKRQLKARA